jgi:hypothetical protein
MISYLAFEWHLTSPLDRDMCWVRPARRKFVALTPGPQTTEQTNQQ